MAYSYSNNASSTLAANIGPAATSLTVATGEGAKFPSSGTFLVTLCKVASGIEYAWEIVSATRSGDVLTITRAQEGTSAGSYLIGDIVSLRVTAAQVGAMLTTNPALGTPVSGVLTNATGLPLGTGVTGTLPVANGGTGATTLTGLVKGTGTTAMVAATAGTDYIAPGGALGTPSSGTATNLTGLPIGTGVSGLGTGVATFLATPSSLNLQLALTSKSGTGLVVLDTNPTISGLIAAGYTEGVTVVSSTTASYTISIGATTCFSITLTSNVSYTFPTAVAGKSFTLYQIQDATGSRTVTWPGTVKWPGGVAPTITSTASKADKFTFTCFDGTNWVGSLAGSAY